MKFEPLLKRLKEVEKRFHEPKKKSRFDRFVRLCFLVCLCFISLFCFRRILLDNGWGRCAIIDSVGCLVWATHSTAPERLRLRPFPETLVPFQHPNPVKPKWAEEHPKLELVYLINPYEQKPLSNQHYLDSDAGWWLSQIETGWHFASVALVHCNASSAQP